MSIEELDDYNKWLVTVWSPRTTYIPFIQDAPEAYLDYLNKNK